MAGVFRREEDTKKMRIGIGPKQKGLIEDIDEIQFVDLNGKLKGAFMKSPKTFQR